MTRKISLTCVRLLVCVAAVSTTSCRHTAEDESYGELMGGTSPIRPTIDGVRLANTHEVISDQSGPEVIRSQAPKTDTDYKQLKALGLTDVLIFKKENKNEVSEEIAEWQNLGISGTHIKSIPMGYANFSDFRTPCQQTIDALKFISSARSKPKGRVLFHCTMGEDRTGYLAGVIALLQGGEPMSVFKEEMCQNGYSAGDPRKPRNVCGQIDRDLTPIYLKMAYFIKKGALSWKKMDPSICGKDPATDQAFTSDAQYQADRYRCKPSTLVN